MAVKIHTEHGDECENDENPRSLLMVSFCSVDPFFGSTRAASVLPSRPPNRTAAARRACQGWPRLRGHPKGLALTGPSTAARSSGSGWGPPQSAPGRRTSVILAPAGPQTHASQSAAAHLRQECWRGARQVIWNFKPLILS